MISGYKNIDEYAMQLIRNLSLQEDYDSEEYPASVDRIIFSYKKDSYRLLRYYIKSYPYEYTLKEYVRWVRHWRNQILPNNYKVYSQKFISTFKYKRSTSLGFILADRFSDYMDKV